MYIYIYFLKKVSYTEFVFHSKNSQINYIVKYLKKNVRHLQINSKGSTKYFWIFYIKKIRLAKYQNKKE